jgi:hypothetical protein
MIYLYVWYKYLYIYDWYIRLLFFDSLKTWFITSKKDLKMCLTHYSSCFLKYFITDIFLFIKEYQTIIFN